MGGKLACTSELCWRVCRACQAGKSVEMENFFSRLTLDIIGKAVFNYDFDSLTHDDPVIQVTHISCVCCPPIAYPPGGLCLTTCSNSSTSPLTGPHVQTRAAGLQSCRAPFAGASCKAHPETLALDRVKNLDFRVRVRVCA